MKRFLFNGIAFLSVFCLPAFFAACVLACLLFMQDNFAEAIFWAYIIDILAGGGKAFGIFPPYFFTACVAVLFLISFKLKEMLRVYPTA